MPQKFLNTTTHSVNWFLKRNREGELRLRPPFQRYQVWTTKQKAYLIDTILRGYPVPELYVQEYADSDGNEEYVVVDGQQRLRACIEYSRDEFGLDAEDSPDHAGMVFSDLADDEKQEIRNYKFVVRQLPEMDDEELRGIFRRLNRSVSSLKKQELRHATYWGDFITSMERIADYESWSELAVFTPNDVRRMLDVEFISELAIAYIHGPLDKKNKLDDWYQAYEDEFPHRQEIESVFDTVARELVKAIPDLSRTRWRKKSDFYTLFLVLCHWSKVIPLSKEGRKALRERLEAFGGSVDAYLKDPDNCSPAENVKSYAAAVQRAASDRGNRKSRYAALHAELHPLLESERD